MKRVWIAVGLLILTAVCCAVTLDRFSLACGELISQAEEMKRAVQSGDDAAAQAALERLDSVWRRERDFFHLLSGSENCELLEEALEQVKVWSSQKEKSPETLSELSNLILNVKRLLQSQQPAAVNLL